MAKTGGAINGRLPKDGNHIAIQVGIAFQTKDATASPQTAPLSYSSSPITVVVPDNAIQMILMPTTDLRISEVSNVAAYDLVKANTKEIIDCAGMQNIYIVRDAADGSLYFRFVTL